MMTESTLTPLQQAALHGIRRVATSQPSNEELAESTANAVLDALPIRGWYIQIDGHGEPTVWAPKTLGGVSLITESMAGPDLWALLAALIPVKAVDDTPSTCGWVRCRREYDPRTGDADDIFCSEHCRAGEMRDATQEAEALFARIAGGQS